MIPSDDSPKFLIYNIIHLKKKHAGLCYILQNQKSIKLLEGVLW